jgi:hypothetical protein
VPFAQAVQLDWSAFFWNCPTEHGAQLASDSLMHVALPTSSGLMSAHFQKNVSFPLNFPGLQPPTQLPGPAMLPGLMHAKFTWLAPHAVQALQAELPATSW